MYVVLYWGIIVRETMAWASGKVLVQHVVVILLIALVGGANATAICNIDLRQASQRLAGWRQPSDAAALYASNLP